MADHSQQPIVVKRIKKGGGGAHGGAWKIAYADFVTAMMAFFLLMWLLGSTTQGDLKGIADYFQSPLKLSLNGGRGTGASANPIEGGGKDLTKVVGDVAKSNFKESKMVSRVVTTPPEQQQKDKTRFEQDRGSAENKNASKQETGDPDAAAEAERAQRKKFQELKGRIEAQIEASSVLRQLKNQLLLDITPDGLRVQIVDEQNRPMFASASADIKPYTRDILRVMGNELNKFDGRLSISGHTDAAQYVGGAAGFTNWELSANRANAARRELILGGLAADRIVRVVGMASSIPLDRSDPFGPSNRRISIVVLNKQAEERILHEAQAAEDAGAAPAPLPERTEEAPAVSKPRNTPSFIKLPPVMEKKGGG